MIVASVLTDLDEWTKSVIFPVVVVIVVGLLGWIGKCLTGIYAAFRRMEKKVDSLEGQIATIASAATAGIEAADEKGERANDRIDRLFPHAG